MVVAARRIRMIHDMHADSENPALASHERMDERASLARAFWDLKSPEPAQGFHIRAEHRDGLLV
jgi:hypothetical protein